MSIMFLEDWERSPGAIADYDTPNTSFKRMVSLYNKMGVKNCLWPLALYNSSLKGVDPHDPDLTEDQKLAIGMECQYNFWYFIREVVRIPPVAGPKPIPYKANRGNLALSWVFMNNIDVANIQPRQTGKSVSTDCIMVWVLYIGASNTTISMLTKDHTLRTKNVERLKKIRDFLPGYLLNITNRDSDNQTDLTCKAKDNTYLTGVGQTSESAANNLGRGLTSPVQHIDEGPFIRFIGTTIPAALASGTAAREEAKQFNRPYGNIFTTTAGKKDDRDGRYMYDLIHGGAVWSELFLDASNREELITLIKRNCTGRKVLVNATFSHRQLGRTDEWLWEAISNAGASGEEADRDFFNVWTSGTQSSPLSVTLNDTIRASEIDPVWNEISKDLYIVRWYYEESELLEVMEENHIILGLDTSDAIGRDAIALTFINSKDLSLVGSATINETNLIRFAKFLSDLMIKYPKLILIPERKSSAQSIIDSLLIHLPRAGVDPFKRIYNHVVDNKDERQKDFQEIQTPLNRRTTAFYDKWKKVIGFNTTGQSRELLYSTVLQNAAKESAHLIKDRTLSSEIRGLVVRNGRIDHASGANDDSVIAWLMSHWFLTHSKNLSYYGIDTTKALSKVHYEGRVLTPVEEFEMEEQNRIREEMEDIYEELTGTNDEFMIAQYESKLYALNKKVKMEEKDALSIDALVNQAAEQREHVNRKRAMEQRRMNRRDLPRRPGAGAMGGAFMRRLR